MYYSDFPELRPSAILNLQWFSEATGIDRIAALRYLFNLMSLVSTCCSKLLMYWHGPFSLCAEELSCVPQGLPGVYVLSAFVPTRPALTAYYVGQSSNIWRRLGEHLAGRRTFAIHLRDRLSTYFSVAAVADTPTRMAAEAALIRRLQPAGNNAIPRAPQFDITLPSLLLLNPP